MGVLDGIRILELARVPPAELPGMMFADMGADVLKIEHPRGDPARTHGHSKDGHGLWWKVIARNKRAATLNLSHPAGREILPPPLEPAAPCCPKCRRGNMVRVAILPAYRWPLLPPNTS